MAATLHFTSRNVMLPCTRILIFLSAWVLQAFLATKTLPNLIQPLKLQIPVNSQNSNLYPVQQLNLFEERILVKPQSFNPASPDLLPSSTLWETVSNTTSYTPSASHVPTTCQHIAPYFVEVTRDSATTMTMLDSLFAHAQLASSTEANPSDLSNEDTPTLWCLVCHRCDWIIPMCISVAPSAPTHRMNNDENPLQLVNCPCIHL